MRVNSDLFEFSFLFVSGDGPRGPPNHHMGPPLERQGPGQGSDGGQYWGDDGAYQEGWRRDPGGPGQEYSVGHRGIAGGPWEGQERFSSHDGEYMGHDRYVTFRTI